MSTPTTPPSRRLRRVLAALSAVGLVLLGITALAGGSDVVLDALLQRPRAESGVAVVPDRFLRSWDPVTVFFPADQVPAAGPADDPAPKVRLEPEHPGAWTWLDRRTLQFRPAEPWPPLDGVVLRVGAKATFLSTLSSPPIVTAPADGAEGLGPVETVTLTFAQPVDPDVLARMTQLELRPLPGIGAGPATRLGRDAFEVKVLDRADLREPARYTLVLREPIPLGQRAVVRLSLSQDQAAAEAVAEIRFATAEPFRPVALGCDGQTLPVSPQGTLHPSERPIRCTGQRAVRVSFTSMLGAVSPVDGRNLVRFEPAVEDLRFEPSGKDLVVRGAFLAEVPYRVSLAPAPFADSGGRALEIDGDSAVFLYFPRREPFLRWSAGQGVAERFGPKRVPADGRGLASADLRIYAVDPLNRSLWPFPDRPVSIDESARPPGPGERPPAWDKSAPIPVHELQQRLTALGSPAFSGIVPLPLEGAGAHFGLDVAEPLKRVSGANAAGHYLVGLRRMDGGSERAWVRLQVTDLALATVETPADVQFQVTSLRSGDGVGGARVRVEGEVQGDWAVLFEGRTGGDGLVQWPAPGKTTPAPTVRRIVVDKGDDTLVIDPSKPPDRFVDGTWLHTGETWLQWAFRDLESRQEKPRTHAHLFPDRPIYRPGEEVHLKGYLRTRHLGRLEGVRGTGRVVVTGPGGAEWRLPVELSGEGSFHAVWSEEEPPTGGYRARYETSAGVTHGQTTFQVEAYRLPTFEVLLDGPEGAATVPNDRPFDVGLSAAYYAGGPVAARPVRWRVTQYPLAWVPKQADGYDGFVWSSDDRYARGGAFRATPELTVEATTSADGGATLQLDPGVEADARPRTYTVEATVTGADDQTVTGTVRVDAVPAFVLGLSAPRYLPRASTIPARVVALGHDGAPVSGLDLTVRLIQRQWHSVLQATDFTAGEAQYLTDVVDVPVDEQALRSSAGPAKVPLPVPGAGVYWVEVEARDALGRVQVVRLDLYAGGDGAVGWEKPKAGTFELSADREAYRPGQTANVVIRSPFQEGRALVVIEAPGGNVYREVAVRGGQGTVSVPIQTGWVPRIPVHVVLRRGRTGEASVGAVDVGKPQTVASTLWLRVEPVENRVEVAVTAPERALPGSTVPVSVALSDPDGKPLAGEVTLWLVDQAVLALGKEQRLDPLPDFIDDRASRIAVRDTRNQVLGSVPIEPMPGGDGDDEEAKAEASGVLESATVRKDMKPLAYYEPSLSVPASGRLTVQVALPDNLTVFKIRAKAASGAERFGVGTGQIAVRLPVVVQPALPRFVRPGDRFDAAAIARVVEGEGGSAEAQIAVEGLTLQGEAEQLFTLSAVEATRLGWPVVVDTPAVGEGGALQGGAVTVRIGARRRSDGASDAVEAALPLRDDRRARYSREIFALAPGASADAAALPEAARAGSVRRTVVLGAHEALIRMASALDVLRSQPPRGTDEVLARARVAVGLGALRGPLGLEDDAEIREIVQDAQLWLPTALDNRGLVAQYPGAEGRVWLTAEALSFLADAASQGYPADPRIRSALETSLVASLRSDYRYFLDGESWWERTLALLGLAAAGRFDEAYFAELARNAKFLVPEAQASVLLAAHRGGKGGSPVAGQVAERLSDEIVLELFQGKPRYAGLKSKRTDRSPRIAPSEAREVATILRGLGAVRPDDDKLGPVLDALIRLGAEDGWGQSNADAAALLALAEAMPRIAAGGASATAGGAPLVVSEAAPVARSTSTGSGAIPLRNTGSKPATVVVLSRWIPEAPGSAQDPVQRGFVVEREWIVVPDGPGTPTRRALAEGGETLSLAVGQVVEEHVRVVNPEERYDVIVTVPLAAGMEPLNPALATSGPEARASNASTGSPTWTSLGDDRAVYAFERLPKGSIDLYFRTKATVAGAFVQPAASAEMVYDRQVIGLSAGAAVEIEGGALRRDIGR
jgi:alpha-2-macroglobulin